MAHVGLDGLDRLAGALRRVPLADPVRIFLRRVPRSELPGPDALPSWLDDRWLEMDAWVDAALRDSVRNEAPGSVEMGAR